MIVGFLAKTMRTQIDSQPTVNVRSALGNASKFFNLDAWKMSIAFHPLAQGIEKGEGGGLHEYGDKKERKELASKPRPEPRRTPPNRQALKLMSYLITMGSREGDIVLDPFCGTATTCIAAMMLKGTTSELKFQKSITRLLRRA